MTHLKKALSSPFDERSNTILCFSDPKRLGHRALGFLIYCLNRPIPSVRVLVLYMYSALSRCQGVCCYGVEEKLVCSIDAFGITVCLVSGPL